MSKKAPFQGNDIHVHQFTIFVSGQTLFHKADLTLAWGHRYGLVGPNGTGKSTLLRHLASREGDFRLPEHMDTLLVEQEVVADDRTALQVVLESDEIRTRIMKEKERLLAMGETDETNERLNAIHDQLVDIDADAAYSRASKILNGLQFSEKMKHQATKLFSGGWRMRISLARALFRTPRLLLLDEPTNHLDLHAVIWLQNYLQSWKNTLVVVSHDRSFLNCVCTDILHIWNQTVVAYKGCYETFAEQHALKVKKHNEEYEKEQKRRKAQKRIDPKAPPPMKPIYDYVVDLPFEVAAPLSGVLVQLSDVTFAYPECAPMFVNIDFGVSMSSRMAIVGPNGSGKSTLLKLCTRELQPTHGLVHHHGKLKLGVFSQHSVDQLDLHKTPVEYILSKFPEVNEQDVRKYLGTIGLPGKIHKHPIHTLSGGQKSRVVLVELQLTRCHILFLDEPTNHLDLETIDGLVNALKDFEGGVVIVTHNVQLVSQVCTEIWECGSSFIELFKGDFDDYAANLLETLNE